MAGSTASRALRRAAASVPRALRMQSQIKQLGGGRLLLQRAIAQLPEALPRGHEFLDTEAAGSRTDGPRLPEFQRIQRVGILKPTAMPSAQMRSD